MYYLTPGNCATPAMTPALQHDENFLSQSAGFASKFAPSGTVPLELKR